MKEGDSQDREANQDTRKFFSLLSKSFTVFLDMCKCPREGKSLLELKEEECCWDVLSKEESGLSWGSWHTFFQFIACYFHLTV